MTLIQTNGRITVDPVEKATAAWGVDMPDWVLVLAETCQKLNQSTVAKRLDYSPAVVSSVLSNSYRGDVARVESMVRGALMAETVDCPVLGGIQRNICLDWQSKAYAATSSHRVTMFRACRDNCPHSRISGTQKGSDT